MAQCQRCHTEVGCACVLTEGICGACIVKQDLEKKKAQEYDNLQTDYIQPKQGDENSITYL